MESVKEFVNRLEKDNEAFFVAGEMCAEAFFRAKPSRETLIKYFRGRCANEHENMTQVAMRLVQLAGTADRETIKLLAKQVFDEAVHFDLVAGVIEHISGQPLDTAELMGGEEEQMDAEKKAGEGGRFRGAQCLQDVGQEDELGLATYQFIAEGRAARIWQRMADISDDPVVIKAYTKIAHDEKFHREIGRRGLEQLATTPEARARVLEMADKMRVDLYEVCARRNIDLPAARELFNKAYKSKRHKVANA